MSGARDEAEGAPAFAVGTGTTIGERKMTMSSHSLPVSGPSELTEELRERAGSFVNNHVGMWVTAEDDGVLVLGGNSPAELFEAAADWLKEGPAYEVAGAVWTRQVTEPAYVLRISLRRPVSA